MDSTFKILTYQDSIKNNWTKQFKILRFIQETIVDTNIKKKYTVYKIIITKPN